MSKDKKKKVVKKKVDKKVDKKAVEKAPEKEAPKKETAKKQAPKKAPKEKVDKSKVEKVINVSKKVEGEINEATGSRFPLNTARQLAFEIVVKCVKKGMNAKDIRLELLKNNKENGCKWNLDAGYLNFVIASHPEYFKYFQDGHIELIKEPVIKQTSAKEAKKQKVKDMKKSAKKVKEMRKKDKKKDKKKK